VELGPHLASLRADLAAAAAVGGEDIARAATLIGDAVEPALRLVLLDLLAEAAEDLTTQLGGATVELRLRGREPELVATAGPSAAAPEPEGTEEGTARLTLRLPETLKARAEAAATAEGQSVNSWLVRAVAQALQGGGFPFPPPPPIPPGAPGPPGPRRLTGYGRA
jgi:hypothetical protein